MFPAMEREKNRVLSGKKRLWAAPVLRTCEPATCARLEMGKHRIFMRHERNIISELRLNYFRATGASLALPPVAASL